MTSRLLYEAVVIELNKENAPNVLLEDFNYFANKAINLYVNKRYNIYDVNLQTTDDLRVLKATATIGNVKKVTDYGDLSLAMGATYEVILPNDYLHLLNCICIYKVHKTYKCYNKDDTWRCAARRLTADAYSLVLDNFWNRPTYKKPYYYIHHVNLSEDVPTNPYNNGVGTDASLRQTSSQPDPTSLILHLGSLELETKLETIGLPKSTKINNYEVSTVEREGQHRYGNVSQVRMEIRYGTDDSIFELIGVYIDYIKTPQYIRLTQEQLDYTEDKSQILEWPDYVCHEIVNELVHIIMENITDLRLQTHPIVTLSIANPAQQLAETAAQAAQ